MPLPTPDYQARESINVRTIDHRFLAGVEREKIAQPIIQKTLVWRYRSIEIANALLSTFEASQGINSFAYGLPGEEDRNWVAVRWSSTRTQGNLYTISATLEEDP